MREYISKTITEPKIINEEVSVICNKCGSAFKPDFNQNMQTINLNFGYESKFDTERWSFELCDNCLIDMIKTFKYVPKGFFQGGYPTLTDNKHQAVFDSWKETGEWEAFKYCSYEEILEFKGLLSDDYINELIQKYFPNKPFT